MSIHVKVYDNGDHTCLVWLPADGKPIPQCRGFTIRRVTKGQAQPVFLHGLVGFSDDDKFDPSAPWKHPVQRFMWWDYGVRPGDVVQYSVVPVTGTRDNLQLDDAAASALTEPMTITGQATAHISAYFNKGIVAAQWVSRALKTLGKNPKMASLIADTTPPGNALRNALSGLLRPQLLQMLADVKKSNGEIYAALYELNDPELIPALEALGQKCHLILANGAFKPANHNDENSAVRKQLHGVVDLHDRIVTGNHFAHNKFVVFCDASGRPLSVLSGSTNWTMTGLCTQANNAVIVDDPDLAADFLNEWNLLKAAGNAYPVDTLAQPNSTSKTFNVDGGTVTQWFAPTVNAPDLDYARKLINAAKQGILFLFFNPGAFVGEDKPENKWTLLQNILFRHHEGTANYDGSLYIRGVVNQEVAGLTTESKGSASKHAALDPSAPTPVTLFDGGKNPPQRLGYDTMVPKNIKDVFHDWDKETLGTGVHIHSKVIVLDPFGEHPVVMTGSHNLGYKASTENDDNLMIVEGNAPLAAAYAINIIATYQAYRWNTYVEAHRQDPRVWHGLVDNDTWQRDYLQGDHLQEYNFWLGVPATAGAAVAQPASGGPVAHTVVAGPAPTTGRAKPAGTGKQTAAKKKSAARKKKVAKKTSAKKNSSKKNSAKKNSAKKKSAKKKSARKKTSKSKKSK